MFYKSETTSALKIGIVHRNRLVREACKRALRSTDIEVAFAVDLIGHAPHPRKTPSAHCLLLEASQSCDLLLIFTDWLEAASVLLFQDMHAVDLSYEAIQKGALGIIDAPVLTEAGALNGQQHFLETLHRFSRSIKLRHSIETASTALEQQDDAHVSQKSKRLPTIIALGASTGGPNALAQILRGLPIDLPAAVLIVQHIEQDFTLGLAQWLSEQTAFNVQIAERGTRIMPGNVYVAPPNRHLIVNDSGHLAHRIGEPCEVHIPSIDVLFESLSKHARPGLACLLTGMGRDGAKGLLALKKACWHTIAQDEASSAVYGMPRAAVELGAETQTLKLAGIGPMLVRHVLTQEVV